MPEIHYQALDAYWRKTDTEHLPQVFLFFGEPYLYNAALEDVIGRLVPEAERNTHLEVLDGENDAVIQAIEQIGTYSLLANQKIVVLRDVRAFMSRQDVDQMLQKSKKALADGEIKKAAGYFRACLGMLDLDLEDLEGKDMLTAFGAGRLDDEDEDWVEKLVAYCREQGLSPSSAATHAEKLTRAIERGFPEGNRLVLTTEGIDKRRPLYKKINDVGLVVNCFVSKGSRKAEKEEQNAVLKDTVRTVLKKTGKRMEARAFAALYEKTGFDLPTFMSNLDKLIDFVGSRDIIQPEDVETVLSRTKTDPIFELTNALAARNPERAVFFLHSLLSSGFHPLQVLGAMTNQVRKLVIGRAACNRLSPDVCRPNMTFNEFKSKTLPKMANLDEELETVLYQWDDMITSTPPDNDKDKRKAKSAKKKKTIASSDVLLFKKPGNAFPIYQLVKHAQGFSQAHLRHAITSLYKADRLLKTTGMDPELILEKTIVDIIGTREDQ
ncbi:MAG: hypothetical protein R6U50_11240 [Desulfobacterales bacterium]